MRSTNKRIFIGNLPPNINECDIKNKFSSYGNIVSTEIKQRKEGLNENVSSVFAFVNIEIDDRALNKCFREFDYDWNGYEIKLEVAKESFLERLKREREEENKKKNVETETEVAKHNHVPSVDKNLYKRTYYSSSSSESEEETEPIKIQAPTKKRKSEYGTESDFNFLNGKSIEADNVDDKKITTEEKSIDMKDKKAQEAEEKRRKSLVLMKNSYLQQKSIIKSSLSNVDIKRNNKIIFDDDVIEKSDNKSMYNENAVDRSSKKNNVSLFEDDGDDEQIDFGIKKQFEGEKGQKLLQLQSRFTNDKRFTLDSRFLDEQECVETNEISEENEKQKQLEILESVLGHKVVNKKPKEILNKDSCIPRKSMLRYDPSKSEHSKFELKDNEKTERKKKKDKEEVVVEQSTVVVSKDTFHKVAGDLKQSLEEKQPFSLLSMFGRAEVDKGDEEEVKPTEIYNKGKKFGKDNNPFKYDSSDSEDEEKNVRKESTRNKKDNSTRLFKKETFFFQPNDERLLEAEEFLQRLNEQVSEKPFNEKRRELKKIVKDKIKNNQRNHRPFRRKLARHKMIKVKKAKKK